MTRLALKIFLTIFATLVLTGAGAIALTWWLIDERKTRIEQEVEQGAERAAQALATGGRDALENWTQQQARDDRSLMSFFVIDEWGDELLGRSLPTPKSSLGTDDEPVEVTGNGVNSLDIPAVLLELPRSMPMLVASDGQRFLLLTSPREDRRGPLGLPDTRAPLVLLALLVAALGSFWLARSITRPIVDLKNVADALASGDLAARVSRETSLRDDEIGRLGVAFDRMADRLSAALTSREQLLRDVSHELRSPLTRMRLAMGLLRKKDATRPDEEIERLEIEIQRLDQLINDILSISRLHGEPGSLRREHTDLRSLIATIAADATFEAQQRAVRVATSLPDEPCHVDVDVHWAAAAIENVVRNALRHTCDGGLLQIDLRAHEAGYQLQITDDGRGVPDDELGKIFEPFHRVERDRDRKSGGTGLGLTIAARVLGAHGGRIEARNLQPPLSGLQLTMWWPTAANR